MKEMVSVKRLVLEIAAMKINKIFMVPCLDGAELTFL